MSITSGREVTEGRRGRSGTVRREIRELPALRGPSPVSRSSCDGRDSRCSLVGHGRRLGAPSLHETARDSRSRCLPSDRTDRSCPDRKKSWCRPNRSDTKAIRCTASQPGVWARTAGADVGARSAPPAAAEPRAEGGISARALVIVARRSGETGRVHGRRRGARHPRGPRPPQSRSDKPPDSVRRRLSFPG